MDRAVLIESPEPGEPHLPLVRHSHDRALAAAVRSRDLYSWDLAGAGRPVRHRMDPPVHRTLLRRQTTRIFQRLSFSVRGIALVGGQDEGQSVRPRRESKACSLDSRLSACARDDNLTTRKQLARATLSARVPHCKDSKKLRPKCRRSSPSPSASLG